MDEIEKIKEELYNSIYENEMALFEDRLRNDPDFGIDELRSYLEYQYNFQDEGWCNRGDVQHIEGQAKVAALEVLLHHLEKEENSK